ncbi:MAG: hypothetical protein JNJ54_02790 [Myxococcaceae bacterium]|nr:hypothetical protein [Myxococcaceae bacterium]
MSEGGDDEATSLRELRPRSAGRTKPESNLKRSWSIGAILAAAALVGAVIGTIAGRGWDDDPDVPMADVERAAERSAPLGTASDVRATRERDPMAPNRELLAGFPPFPGARPRAMGTAAFVSGMPLELAWFSTKASAAEVIRFYEAGFEEADLFWVTQWRGPQMGSVGYLERDDELDAGVASGVMRLVSVLGREGGGETLVFLSRSRPQWALEGQGRLPAGVVLPRGAVAPAVVEVSEEGSKRATIATRVSSTRVAEVARALEARLQGEGWALSQVVGDERRTTLSARKNGASQTYALRQEADAVEVLVSHQTR